MFRMLSKDVPTSQVFSLYMLGYGLCQQSVCVSVHVGLCVHDIGLICTYIYIV